MRRRLAIALERETKVKLNVKVTNRDRTVGTLLSSAIARLRHSETISPTA